jgi:hypothetical protein
MYMLTLHSEVLICHDKVFIQYSLLTYARILVGIGQISKYFSPVRSCKMCPNLQKTCQIRMQEHMGSDEKAELNKYLASRDDINTIFGMLE